MKAKHLSDIRLDRANYKEKRNHQNYATTGMSGNGLVESKVKVDMKAAAAHHNVKKFVKNDSNARNGAVVIVGQSVVEKTLLEKAIAFRKEAKKRAREAEKAKRDLAKANREYHERQAELLPSGGGLQPQLWVDRTKL